MFGFLMKDHPEIMLRDSCVDASCLTMEEDSVGILYSCDQHSYMLTK